MEKGGSKEDWPMLAVWWESIWVFGIGWVVTMCDTFYSFFCKILMWHTIIGGVNYEVYTTSLPNSDSFYKSYMYVFGNTTLFLTNGLSTQAS